MKNLTFSSERRKEKKEIKSPEALKKPELVALKIYKTRKQILKIPL